MSESHNRKAMVISAGFSSATGQDLDGRVVFTECLTEVTHLQLSWQFADMMK